MPDVPDGFEFYDITLDRGRGEHDVYLGDIAILRITEIVERSRYDGKATVYLGVMHPKEKPFQDAPLGELPGRSPEEAEEQLRNGTYVPVPQYHVPVMRGELRERNR